MGLRLTVKEAAALGIKVPPPKHKYSAKPSRIDGKASIRFQHRIPHVDIAECA